MSDPLPPEFDDGNVAETEEGGSPPADSFDTFVHLLTETGIHPDLLIPDEKGSLSPQRKKRPPTAAPSLATLAPDEIRLKESIGHGGMGEVLVGEQTSLGREVAVKRTRSKQDQAFADGRLILEARVAGYVEHPNVVPVHLLGSEDGKPLLVMKRIEGQTWKELLAEGADLERDLPILMEVCQALHYAHSRGVVHRDVKPGNVMVGAFGEVYLLDWGLAAGFGDVGPESLAHVDDDVSVVGTPAYLPPEMAMPAGDPDPASDVYLAGACLHEVITGRAPHGASTLLKTLHVASQGVAPEFDDDVPEELQAICRQAMARDPADRFGSADQLREALAGFMRHRAARDLATEAETRLAALLDLPPDASDREAQTLFAECRFGFQHALSVWPASSRARAGLNKALTAMAWRYVGAEHTDQVELLVAELGDDVDAALTSALAALVSQRDEERERSRELQILARDVDLRTALTERTLIILAGAFAWLLMTLVMTGLAWSGRFEAGPWNFSVGLGLVSLAFLLAYTFVSRVRENAASRATARTMIATALALSATHGLSGLLTIPSADALALGQIPLALGMAAICNLHGRPWGVALVSVVVLPAMLVWPPHALWLSGAGAFVSVAWLVTTWRPSSRSVTATSHAP